jgi:hypothetical protein
MKNKEVKYTILQRLLWSISGNEVWLIKKFPTTYKYYSRQGLLFVMTFFFAAFCGAFAGYDFGGNWWITILFGLIWGLLVYSIDQMMVLTIDKVHVKDLSVKKKLGTYFFPRLFLGILLALFMSSPLDHFLFEGQIKKQMQINADSTWMRYHKELESVMKLEDTRKELDRLQRNKDSLDNAKNKDPKTIIFQEAKTSYDQESLRLRSLNDFRNNKEREKDMAWNRIPPDSLGQKDKTSREYFTYLSKQNEYDRAVKDYISKEKEVGGYKEIITKERTKYQEDLENRIKRQDTLVVKSAQQFSSNRETIDSKTKEKQDFLSQLDGFDTKFMTLLTLPDFGVQFLRWFIFLVFLMIEILPTWIKLMGQPTDYDIELDKIRKEHLEDIRHEREKAKIQRQSEMEDIQHEREKAKIQRQFEIERLIEQEKQRKSIELDNHKKILEQIAEKQYNIVQMILNEWVEKNKNGLSEE